MSEISINNKNYYFDTISVKNFYYKEAIYEQYKIIYSVSILPIEIIDKILYELCKEVIVCLSYNNILYINPKDNKIIKKVSFDQSKINFDSEIDFKISSDGLTLYSKDLNEIYIRSLHNDIDNDCIINYEYLIEELTSIRTGCNKFKFSPSHKLFAIGSSGICYWSRDDYSINSILGNPVSNDMIPGNIACRNDDDMNIVAIFDIINEELITEIKFKNNSLINNIINICFSPDETLIMVLTEYDNNPNLWIFNINGTFINNFSFEFLKNNKDDYNISWGPNNIISIPTVDPNGNTEIYLLKLNNNNNNTSISIINSINSIINIPYIPGVLNINNTINKIMFINKSRKIIYIYDLINEKLYEKHLYKDNNFIYICIHKADFTLDDTIIVKVEIEIIGYIQLTIPFDEFIQE
jgi:hypothetical protein